MGPFIFTLARMRGYKQQILDKEKNTLRRLQKRKEEIRLEIEMLQEHIRRKTNELREKQRVGMHSSELSTYKFYIENAKLQIEENKKLLIKAELEVEHQLQVVVTASQEVSALDKLEEKQLEEYRLLENKENELKILEYVTTSIVKSGKEVS